MLYKNKCVLVTRGNNTVSYMFRNQIKCLGFQLDYNRIQKKKTRTTTQRCLFSNINAYSKIYEIYMYVILNNIL